MLEILEQSYFHYLVPSLAPDLGNTCTVENLRREILRLERQDDEIGQDEDFEISDQMEEAEL